MFINKTVVKNVQLQKLQAQTCCVFITMPALTMLISSVVMLNITNVRFQKSSKQFWT